MGQQWLTGAGECQAHIGQGEDSSGLCLPVCTSSLCHQVLHLPPQGDGKAKTNNKQTARGKLDRRHAQTFLQRRLASQLPSVHGKGSTSLFRREARRRRTVMATSAHSRPLSKGRPGAGSWHALLDTVAQRPADAARRLRDESQHLPGCGQLQALPGCPHPCSPAHLCNPEERLQR